MARLDLGIVDIFRSAPLGHQVEPEPALAGGAFLLASPGAQTATRFCRKLQKMSSLDCYAHSSGGAPSPQPSFIRKRSP